MRDTMAATAEGVRGAFSDVDVRLDAASLKEAQRLCTTYNLDADDLALKWEVFAYNKVRGMEGGGSREGGGGDAWGLRLPEAGGASHVRHLPRIFAACTRLRARL